MRRATPSLLGVLALLLVSAVSASAGAAEPTGNATLVISAAKARLLAEREIGVEGIRGAESEGRETRLQVGGGTIGAASATLATEGGLRFAVGDGKARRVARLTGFVVELGPDARLSARLNGGKRRTVFELVSRPGGFVSDAAKGIAQLHGARLIWRRSVARALSRRLGANVPRGPLGRIRVSAAT
ncbi:MAG TPA: hypothetical protein VFM94_03665, partial [Solirubrobacterales bacterium]|nr:hypothetical protein [Solirubrobacterales bacterium]